MSTSLRIKFVFLSLLGFAFLVLLRLFYWQFLQADQLAVAAQKQHQSFRQIPAARGQILAADGFPLVTNKQAFLLFASLPDLEESPTSLAHKLASFLVKADEEKLAKENSLKEKLQKPDLVWVPLEHKVSRQAKEKIESLSLTGLGFEDEPLRSYPEGTASAHLLGFVGRDLQGDEKGYFGLEGFYDLQLQGRPGLVWREKDATGKPILFGLSKKQQKRDGQTLLSTLDRSLQFIVEKKLQEGLAKYGALSGSVVIMDPHTGAVLSMVSLPTYDPLGYSQFEESNFLNPVTSLSYEPGSTFKILVMAAAIDQKVIKPDSQCPDCDGPRVIADYTLDTWNSRYYPNSTMTEVIIHSDNVGMVFVAESLGIEKLFPYLKKFGLGQLTGIDVQDEDTPSLRPQKDWRLIDLATASFGQGIALTPIQMITASAAIANGGYLVQPYLIQGVYEEGKLVETKPKEKKRVLSQSTAEIITQMMVEAVEKGEAQWVKPQGFKVAGKTGTAQIPVAGHYDEEKTIASFIGFAPTQNPRFIMLVTLKEPSSSPWGSETAAPLWFSIAQELFTYYGIMPD